MIAANLSLSGGYLSVYLGLELPQLIRYGGVQYQHGGGAVRGGTYGTELKKRLPVKAKGEVRLRSVLSINNSGIRAISSFIALLSR